MKRWEERRGNEEMEGMKRWEERRGYEEMGGEEKE